MKNKMVGVLVAILVVCLIVIAFLAGMLFNMKTNEPAQDEIPKTEVQTPVDDPAKTPEVEEKNGFTDQEALEAADRYLNFYSACRGSAVYALQTTGLISGYEDIDMSTGFYAATNVSFDTFMGKMNELMTPAWYENSDYFTKFFQNQNGTLYVSTGAASGYSWKVKEVTKTSDNNYTGKADFLGNGGYQEEYTVNFTVAEGTGANKCVIDNCVTFKE